MYLDSCVLCPRVVLASPWRYFCGKLTPTDSRHLVIRTSPVVGPYPLPLLHLRLVGTSPAATLYRMYVIDKTSQRGRQRWHSGCDCGCDCVVVVVVVVVVVHKDTKRLERLKPTATSGSSLPIEACPLEMNSILQMKMIEAVSFTTLSASSLTRILLNE